MARDLFDLLDEGVQGRKEAVLNEGQFLNVLQGAAELFREGSLRQEGAIPVRVFNDPGVLKSRKIKVVDVAGAQHGMEGTGGNEDVVDFSSDDQVAYAMWHTVRVPWRVYEASKRDPTLDLLRNSGQAIGEVLRELENQLIVDGLGPLKGVTNATGITTFASAGAWTTAGIAWQDLTKAIATIRNKKAPTDRVHVLVNPLDWGNAMQTFSNTDMIQLDKASQRLGLKFFPNTNVDAGKAYVYPFSPNVLELIIYQDLSVFPLPTTDEDPRLRGRIIASTHYARPSGIVEITSIDT